MTSGHDDLDEELQAYLDAAIEDRMARGVPRDEAVRQARAALGSRLSIHEQVDDERHGRMWRSFCRDFRFASRALRGSPAFVAATVVTIALASGAASTVFGAVYSVLLAPLPIGQPDRLVVAWETAPAREASVVEISYGQFERWSTKSQGLSHGAAMGSSLWPAVMKGVADPVRVSTAGVSSSFFETLGVQPLLGRSLNANDDQPNGEAVAVISHGAWTRHFGADPVAVGRSIELDRRRRIVGVMPRGFDFPTACDFWILVRPILQGAGTAGSNPLQDIGVLVFIGRLRERVTVEQAAAELDGLASSSPDGTARRFGSAVVVTPFLDYAIGPIRKGLWALWVSVGLLVVIAAANVSGLFSTRISLRRYQDAMCLALGADRRHLLRRWLLEVSVVVALGTALGWMLTFGLLKVVVALAPANVPRLAEATVSPAVSGFTIVMAVVVAILCCVAPARQVMATRITEVARNNPRASAASNGRPFRSALVTMQIALAVVLLISSGLIARSYAAMRLLNVGFVPSGVLTAFVQAPSNVWMRELLGRLKTHNEIQAAGAIYLRPLELGRIGQEAHVVLEGQPDTQRTRRENPVLNYQVASAGYFAAVRTPLVAGRPFSGDEGRSNERVAIVSERTARALWPGQSAIGRKLLLSSFDGDRPDVWRTVVGVAAEVHYRGLGDVRLDVYDSADQAASVASYLAVRSDANPGVVAGLIRAEAKRLTNDVVVDSFATLDEILQRATAPWSFSAWLLAVLAVCGVSLAAVGLFGLVSLDAASRTHELAIRHALGATRLDLMRTVLVPAGWRTVAGTTIGLLAAVPSARALGSLLFGVEPLDVLTWTTTVLMVAGVAAIAAYLPARTAAAIDPISLLRHS